MRKEYSWDIIRKFSGKDQDCFNFQDIIDEYPDTDSIYLSKVLSGMVEKGMLIKLNRNLYHIVPPGEDSSTYIPDWHLVAKYVMKGKDYYVGYYSAMQIHGLITQPSLKEIIVTNRQVVPSSRTIKNVEFQFVTLKTSRFFGFRNTWINQHEKVMVSDLEKTIVDAVSKPHLCGGMIEIGRAVYDTKEKIHLDKLMSYLIRNESNVAIKRYLYLCDLLDVKWTPRHDILIRNLGSGFSLLDTTGPDQGKKNSKFRLRINIDADSIRNALFT